MSLTPLFDSTCLRFPQRTALKINALQISYEQLAREVTLWSEELENVGLHAQERVLVAVREPLSFVALWFALWRIECIPIPLEASTVEAELSKAVQESRAHWIIAHTVPIGKNIFPLKKSDLQPTWIYSTQILLSDEQQPSDTALFFYTSGTTGAPKCVMFNHASITANALSVAQAIGLSEHDTILTPLAPMLPATLATVLWPAFCMGATVVLLPHATPGHILREIVATHTTIFYAVPYIYNLLTASMTRRPQRDWGNVRLCLSSSALLHEQTINNFQALTQLPIRSLYCSSEAGACTYNASDDAELIRASVGQPLPGVVLHIVDDSRHVLPIGTEGQILAHGTHLASGYFCRPELQQQVFIDGWVSTGDSGFVDSQGYVHLTGRLVETINISGYLVHPGEVEHSLLTHPSVAEALVYGLEDANLGEIIAATLVLGEGAPMPSVEELTLFCADKLAHYKVPRRFHFVSQLAKGRYGKTKRFSLTKSNAAEEKVGEL